MKILKLSAQIEVTVASFFFSFFFGEGNVAYFYSRVWPKVRTKCLRDFKMEDRPNGESTQKNYIGILLVW